MNHNQPTYPTFNAPPQQSHYPYNTSTYGVPQQTTPYGYPSAVPPLGYQQQQAQQSRQPLQPPQQHQSQQQHQPQQQQHQPQQQQHQPQQQHYYQSLQSLTQTSTPRSRQQLTPSRSHALSHQSQHRPNVTRPDASSIPSSPGNGPGAPPPDPDSPNIEDELMNALGRNDTNANDDENDNGADNDNDNDDDDADDAEEDPDDPVYNLPAPPAGIYPSVDDLDKAIHDWSLHHGYELVRRQSKKNARGHLYKRFYHCSKHGHVKRRKNPNPEKTRSNRKSKRTGCPMSLIGVACEPHDPTGSWLIRLRKVHHNHPAQDGMKLAGHRRRARQGGVEDAVDALLNLNTGVPDIHKFLQKTHPDGLFTRTDVGNMKLKWKKYGTCAKTDGPPNPPDLSNMPPMRGGPPTACRSCRAKKTKCDAIRPVCANCVKRGSHCQYDPVPVRPPPRFPPPPQPQPATAPGASDRPNIGDNGLSGINATNFSPPAANNTTPTTASNNNTTAQPTSTTAELELRAMLDRFQSEHITPTRLTLASAEVEYLATSTCGNGDSYKHIPTPFTAKDWTDYQAYRNAFLEAARKENTYDVLIGAKRQPVKPVPAAGENEVDVKVWNEYIKQLAIYYRRNSFLLGALLGSLAPNVRCRVNGMQSAHEAWRALEDLSAPRGSEQAFKRFIDFRAVTLQSCGGALETYITRFKAKAEELNQLDHENLPRDPRIPATLGRPRLSANLATAAAAAAGIGGGEDRDAVSLKGMSNGCMSEAILCFQFLEGLGEEHRALVVNLCRKGNVGGFGSGERLELREVVILVRGLFNQ